jgi:hypothetical protein
MMNPEFPYKLKSSAFSVKIETQSLDIPYSRIRPTRIQVAAWIALVLLAVAISVRDYDAYQFGTHWDDSQYATLARSLVFSDRYGLVNVPGQPLPAKYPFAYPLLLVPFLLISPENFDVLKSMSLIATLLNAVLLFWCWRSFSRTRSYNWALAITGLYVLAPMIIDHTRRVMSEPIFTTFCLLALVLTEQAARGQRGKWWTLQMSLALMFALFTRTIGFVLIAAVFAYLLFRLGRTFWKEIALIVAEMAILLGVIVAATPLTVTDLLPAEYLKDDNARVLVGADITATTPEAEPPDTTPAVVTPPLLSPDLRIRYMVFGWLKYQFGTYLRQVALPIGGGDKEQTLADSIGLSFLPALIGYLVAALVVMGLWRFQSQEGLNVFLFFSVLYFGSLSLWIWNDPRLLYPIQPQIQLGFLLGLEAIFFWIASALGRAKRWPETGKLFFASIGILLIVGSACKSLLIEDSRLHAGDLAARTRWLKSNSASSDIIMTEAPEVDYLYSGRKTVWFPLALVSKDRLENYITRNRVAYILVAPNIEWQKDYVPRYTATMAGNLAVLAGLAAEHRVQLVYSSETSLIQVYKTLP